MLRVLFSTSLKKCWQWNSTLNLILVWFSHAFSSFCHSCLWDFLIRLLEFCWFTDDVLVLITINFPSHGLQKKKINPAKKKVYEAKNVANLRKSRRPNQQDDTLRNKKNQIPKLWRKNFRRIKNEKEDSKMKWLKWKQILVLFLKIVVWADIKAKYAAALKEIEGYKIMKLVIEKL